MTDATINLISVASGMLFGIINILFKIRPKLIWWSTNRRKFEFDKITVFTKLITICNASFFRTAENVEIIIDGKIDQIEIYPPKAPNIFRISTGQNLIQLGYIHPREQVSIETLGFGSNPSSTYLAYVNSSNSKTKEKRMKAYPLNTNFMAIVGYLFMLLGVAFFTRLIIQLAEYLF